MDDKTAKKAVIKYLAAQVHVIAVTYMKLYPTGFDASEALK